MQSRSISKLRSKTALLGCAALAGIMAINGCRKEDMADQPRRRPYDSSEMFADGAASRPLVPHTVARGQLRTQADLYTGLVVGADGGQTLGADGLPKEIDYIPLDHPINGEDLIRGQKKFIVFCSPCHGQVGDGNGMIVQRGMIRPPSLVKLDRPATEREQRVQNAPIGHYFSVITNGYGAMYSYNDRIVAEDRWRIAAYIRALQVSQDAGNVKLTDAQQQKLTAIVAAQAEVNGETAAAEIEKRPGHRDAQP